MSTVQIVVTQTIMGLLPLCSATQHLRRELHSATSTSLSPNPVKLFAVFNVISSMPAAQFCLPFSCVWYSRYGLAFLARSVRVFWLLARRHTLLHPIGIIVRSVRYVNVWLWYISQLCRHLVCTVASAKSPCAMYLDFFFEVFVCPSIFRP